MHPVMLNWYLPLKIDFHGQKTTLRPCYEEKNNFKGTLCNTSSIIICTGAGISMTTHSPPISNSVSSKRLWMTQYRVTYATSVHTAIDYISLMR